MRAQHHDKEANEHTLRVDAPRKAEISLQPAGSGLSLASPQGLVPVPLCLSKIGTHLLASSHFMGKYRNSLACLRNGGSYFSITYCIQVKLFSLFHECLKGPVSAGHCSQSRWPTLRLIERADTCVYDCCF